MTDTLIVYRPKEGADIVIKIMRDNVNISPGAGFDLYAEALRDNPSQELSSSPGQRLPDPNPQGNFSYNEPYFFKNGLTFRTFAEERPAEAVLEFGTNPLMARNAEDRQRALASIPVLLKRVGIDADCTALEKILASDSQR